MAEYKVIESASGYNTAIAAGATERVINEPTYSRQKNPNAKWNYLEIKNRDAVAFQIQVDGLTSGAKVFELESGGTLVKNVEEGMIFDYIIIKNLDSAAAVANKLLVKAEYREKIA